MSAVDGTIYEYEAKDINGQATSLSKYKGKVVLVVNVACNCGFTKSNYPDMQQLYEKYKDNGFEVAAFPSNQFAGQEPLSEPEILKTVKDNYGVTFDMYSKINVNGNEAHPLYQFLKKAQGGLLFDAIKWNFTKFLIDRDGHAIKRYGPNVKPSDIENDIKAALGI